jgi:hypothetical protein
VIPPVLALLAMLVLGALPSHARAEWEPSGSLAATLHLEVGGPGDRGGALLVDLWERWDFFRLGLAAGVGALTSDDDEGDPNRAFAPIGLSMGIVSMGERVGGSFTVRAGPWGGATKDGLNGGFWATAGASFDVRWGERLVVSFFADFWLIAGAGQVRTLVAPGVALRWDWPDPLVPEPRDGHLDVVDPASFQEEPP